MGPSPASGLGACDGWYRGLTRPVPVEPRQAHEPVGEDCDEPPDQENPGLLEGAVGGQHHHPGHDHGQAGEHLDKVPSPEGERV